MEGLKEYLENDSALRFAERGELVPNFEVKFPKTELNNYSLHHKILVKIGDKKINTSVLELQIPFKLYLGSEKDFEDAAHLWQIFKNHLNHSLFDEFIKRLNVEDKLKELD